MDYLYFIVLGFGLCLIGLFPNLLAVYRYVRGTKRVTEEQKVEAAQHKKMMEELVKHPGWKLLEAAAKVQSTSRQNEIMLKPTENPLVQEYAKGEVQGIQLFITLPKNLIESSKAILDAYEQQGE